MTDWEWQAKQWKATALAHTAAADKLQAERDRLRNVLREIADEASDEWAQKIAREALEERDA